MPDNLETITNRSIYENYIISGINTLEGFESIEFSNTQELSLGQSIGDVDELTKKRELIKRTIEAHLEKERIYIKKGIKVLSLFFIDDIKGFDEEDITEKLPVMGVSAALVFAGQMINYTIPGTG